MITLQTPIPHAPAARAAGVAKAALPDAAGSETANGMDFASLMSAILPAAPRPGDTVGAAPAAEATASDASQDETVPQAIAAAGSPAIAQPALPPMAASVAAVADPAAAVRGRACASALDTPRARSAAPRGELEAPRAPGAQADLHGQPQPAASAPDLPASLVVPARNPTADGTEHEMPTQIPAVPSAAAQQAQDGARASLPEMPASLPASRSAEAASPAHATRIDALLGSPRWREDLAAHVAVMAHNAVPQAEIRVTPPELGPIHVRVSVDQGVAAVTLSAAAPETRDALEAALTSLRERLAESGLALGEASVSGEHSPRSDDRAQRDATGAAYSRQSGAAPPPGAPVETVRRMRLDGLVDLYA